MFRCLRGPLGVVQDGLDGLRREACQFPEFPVLLLELLDDLVLVLDDGVICLDLDLGLSEILLQVSDLPAELRPLPVEGEILRGLLLFLGHVIPPS